MTVLADHVDERSEAYQANRAHLLELIAEHDRQLALVNSGGGEKYVARHRQRGKLLARERVELLIDADSPLLELSPLAAWGTDFPVGAGAVHRRRGDRGRRVRDHRQRPDRPRRHEHRRHRAQEPAGDGDRQAEPPAAGQPRRVGRRRPPPPERDLHPRRAGLPRPHRAVVDGRADDRPRVRQLDRRRRLRARHERLRRDDRPALQGLPRRAAAGEDGDRRGERRREPRRRRHARPRQRPRRLLRPRRARRPAHRPAASCAASTAPSSARRPRGRAARPATTPSSCSASRRPTCGCRSTRATCWPASSTTASSTSSSPATARRW